MANLRNVKSKSKQDNHDKLAQAADLLDSAEKHALARTIRKAEHAKMLNNLIQGTALLRIESEVSAKLKEVVGRLDALNTMRELVADKPKGEALKEITAIRLMQDHPSLSDHFMRLLGNSVGYDEVVRQLMVHHNYDNMEGGDINDLLYQVNELLEIFRGLTTVHQLENPTQNRRPAA